MTAAPEKLAYRMDEAAAAIGLSKPTLYRLVKAGELRTFKMGHRTLIRREELEALIDRKAAA